MNNKVYWLRQTENDVPASNSWLGIAEQQRLETLRIPKRRADWRLGRWTAKKAVSLCLNVAAHEHSALSRIEIRAAESGAPEVFLRDVQAPISASLSHRDGVCICAVAPAGVELGCDVEAIEPHCPEFIIDYFDLKELNAIADAPNEDRILLVSLMWSAKESTLKAIKEGLRADARSVCVSVSDWSQQGREWNSLQALAQERLFHGWWKTDGRFVYSFAADVSIAPPTLLLSDERASRAVNL